MQEIAYRKNVQVSRSDTNMYPLHKIGLGNDPGYGTHILVLRHEESAHTGLLAFSVLNLFKIMHYLRIHRARPSLAW
jgi:hypothetical protein